MLKKFIEWSKKNFCSHKIIKIKGTIEEGTLSEPEGGHRKIKIAIIRTFCPSCDKTFKITPYGIVFDPVKDINKNFSEKEVIVPSDVRREILRGR